MQEGREPEPEYDPVKVNDLVLPAALIAAISDDRWAGIADPKTGTADYDLLEQVFGVRPFWPRFYSLAGIRAMNSSWVNETDIVYVGVPGDVNYPGDIDPRKSLLIAELGPDQLIALDYRRKSSPEVLYAADDGTSPWKLVASSVEELLELLQVDELK